MIHVRLARPSDLEPLAKLRAALWPESRAEEHAEELVLILAGKPPGILPLVEFVAEANDGALAGFLEAGLRSCSDGCDWSRPVGYVEGLYVIDGARRQGVGAKLLAEAESWAREQGCVEMASDTQITNELSQQVHEALGFEVTERAVIYRKSLL